MILKKIVHKAAQTFRLAQVSDKKLSTGIAAALDAKAEQLREYEKSFEPEPPEPNRILCWKRAQHWRRLDSVQQQPYMRSGDSRKH